MARDHLARAPVAWLVALIGACGPSIRPPAPPPEPGPVERRERPRPPTGSDRPFAIGEMCPQAAAGRPAIMPLVMRTVLWTDEPVELANAVERGSIPRFSVFGVDGKVAGVFDTLGLADIGLPQAVASGTYVGAPPCTADAGGGQRKEDPKCAPATGNCALAVGLVARPDDPPETETYRTGGACLQDNALAVDIDGDKVMELFPLAGVLDGARHPAAEWTAAPVVGAACTPAFQVFGIRFTPKLEAGRSPDAKHVIGVDVLGVVDLDGDGRMEVALALQFPTARTIVIYTATGSAQRLELAGEGAAFPR